jgi:HEAT repeat protein
MRVNQHIGRWISGAAAIVLILAAGACSPERRDWKKAQESGAENSYISYLEKHPQGEHVAAAKVKIEELAFRSIAGRNSLDALKEFLARHPDGAYSRNARESIDDLSWKAAAASHSLVAFDAYLSSFPQGRHADEARAGAKAVLAARPPEWRDVRTVKFVLRQTFSEEVKDVTIGFERELDKFYPFIGIANAAPDAAADAVLTVVCEAEAWGASYATFAFAASGTYYYTGAHVSGRAVLEIPGQKSIREDFDGARHVPQTISFGGATTASGAPFDMAMRKDFPKKAGRLLARAFGYVPMIGALASRDADLIAGAVLALQSGGAPALELLLRAVEDADVGVRVNAARALKGHMNAGAIAALIKSLGREGDGDKEVRRSAAESLAALGVPAVPALAEASKDAKAVTREGAATALGGIHTAPSLALITALFDDPEKSVREAAIRSAGEHRSRAAVATLIDRLGTAKPDACESLLSAIGNSLENTAINEDEESEYQSTLDWDRDLIARFAAKAPALAEDPKLRDQAAGIFERIGGSALGAVGPMLRSESVAVRAWAAEVLGKLSDEGAIRLLAQAAGDADANVRVQVAKALGSFSSDPAIIEPLSKLLLDASPGVGSEALLSLGRVEDQDDVKPYIRRNLASADKVKVLIDKLTIADSNKSAEREAAASILGMLGRAAVEPLTGVLKSGDKSAWTMAVTALGKTGDAQAAAALIEFAKDPAVQADDSLMTSLYKSLGGTKSVNALDMLCAGVKDAARDRKSAAIDALKELGNIRGAEAIVGLLPTEDAGLASDIDAAMRELTKYEPEGDTFDWKAWWAKNRARYGLK